MEGDRIERWRRISTIDVEAEPVHALRMAIVLVCEAPDDLAAREELHALAIAQGMSELLVPLLCAEARVTRDPSVLATLHDERTRALAAIGEPRTSLRALAAAVTAEPDRPEHREQFAHACYLAGAWTQAGEALEQLAPYLPAAHAVAVLRAAGRLYRNAGRSDRALAAYRTLAVRQPSDVETLALLAELINSPRSGNTVFDPAALVDIEAPPPPPPPPQATEPPAVRLHRPTGGRVKIFDRLDFDEVDARLAFAFGDDASELDEVVLDLEPVELSPAPVVARDASMPRLTPPAPVVDSPSPPAPPPIVVPRLPPSPQPVVVRDAPVPRLPPSSPPAAVAPRAPLSPTSFVSPSPTPPTPPPPAPPAAAPVERPPIGTRAPTPVPLARVARRLGRVEKPPIVEVARPPKPKLPSVLAQPPAPPAADDDKPAHTSVEFDAIDDTTLEPEPDSRAPTVVTPSPVELSAGMSSPNLILRETSGGVVVPPEIARTIDEAKAAVRAGDLRTAELRLRALVRTFPREQAGHLALVDLLRANKRYDDAADYLEEALADSDESALELRAALVHRYALVASAAGAPDDAHEMLCDAHELDPGSLPIALALGESYFARGAFQEAAHHLGSLADHPQVGSHVRGVARGLVHAAVAETRLQRPERALEHYESALRLDPGCTPAAQALAERRPSHAAAPRR